MSTSTYSADGPDQTCGSRPKGKNDTVQPLRTSAFEPLEYTQIPPLIDIPSGQWLPVLGSPCTFPPEIFIEVMLNLVKNPNLTSSHLFRADILYDSETNRLPLHLDLDDGPQEDPFVKHLKAVYRPIKVTAGDYKIERTLVRELVPRNPRLDRPLVQTCHFLHRTTGEEEVDTILLLIPHVSSEDEIPFYHPAVERIAIQHQWRPQIPTERASQSGKLSISIQPFPSSDSPPQVSAKVKRTALRLLQTAHKHGQGQLAGYEKRVHHDRIIPQKRYQDTYARLKATYGKQLASQWVEATDPSKHVFEDLGIAAYLIELWRDMYADDVCHNDQCEQGEHGVTKSRHASFVKQSMPTSDEISQPDSNRKPPFPGFVDIGCGNGVLNYILLSEGYPGWGFDARARKTWSIFPQPIQRHLRRCILVPEALRQPIEGKIVDDPTDPTTQVEDESPTLHDGVFQPGTFIISNHADELTAWTPLLALRNNSAFIAIPCCSHDLSGARFRAPAGIRSGGKRSKILPQQISYPDSAEHEAARSAEFCNGNPAAARIPQAAETGSLKTESGTTKTGGKMQSAYSTLCTYVTALATDVGFDAEVDVLRIPSTRNTCIVGRRWQAGSNFVDGASESTEDRVKAVKDVIRNVVERETGRSVEDVGRAWMDKAINLGKKPGSGH